MKKVFKSLLVTVAAALAFASCQREGDVSGSEGRTVRFFAGPVETRTAFTTPDATGKYPVLWTENDTKVKVSMNLASAKEAAVTPNGATAEFEATFDNLETATAPYTFYALSPSTAYVSISGQSMDWGLQIPSDQTPGEGTPDERAQILAGVSQASSSLDEVISLDFSHVTAYGRMSLSNLDLTGVAVTGVSLTAEVPLAGRFFYYVADTNEHSAGDVVANSTSNTLNLITDSVRDIWFACAPADISGTTLGVTVYTANGLYEKAITVPANRKFEAGKIAKFTIDMTGATRSDSKEYELVTDPAQLSENSIVIIADKGGSFAMNTTQNSNNRSATVVMVNDDKIINPFKSVEELTIEAGTTSGTFAFKGKDGKYLVAENGNNRLKSSDEKTALGSFTVTITNGVTTVNAASCDRGDMRFNANSGNPIFNCYASSSTAGTAVDLYKMVGSGSDEPIFQATLEGANESGLLTVPASTTTATIHIVSNVDWEVYSDDDVTFSEDEGDSSAEVVVTFPANETDEAVTYTINIESDLGEFEFVITQEAAVPVGESLYQKVTTITAGKKYIIAAYVNGKLLAATPIPSNKNYDYPAGTEVSSTDGVIEARHTDLELSIEATTGGYTIQQADGRYWALKGDYPSVNVYNTVQESYVWTVSGDVTGDLIAVTNVEKNKLMGYDTEHSSYGFYPSLTSAHVQPALYEFIEGSTVTFDFANMGLENGVQYDDPFTSDGYSVSFTGGGNDGKYYTTGTGIRTYGDGSIVVAGTGITGIEYTFQNGSGYYPTAGGYTLSTGTLTPGAVSTWTGSASEVTLTRNTGNGHWRLQKVVITYDSSAPPVVETVATPTFSPAAGEVAAGTTVTISCATAGATIHYTTDGSTPTASSTTGTSVTVNAAMTIKAIAVKSGMNDSAVATANYTIQSTPPSGDDWTLVTSVSDLAVGDQIIIVCEAKSKAAGAISGSNKFLSAESVTVSNHAIANEGSALVFTLGQSGGNWTLTGSGQLLGATAAKSLVMGSGTTTWTISIDSNGTATIASTNSDYGRILYNATNPRFMNYTSSTTSSMLLPQIYKN